MSSIVGALNAVRSLVAAKTPAVSSANPSHPQHPLIQALSGAAKPSAAPVPQPSIAAAAATAAPAAEFVPMLTTPVAVLSANATLGAATAKLADMLEHPSTSGAVHLGFTATLGGAGNTLLAASLTGAAGDIAPGPQPELQVVQLHGGGTVTFQSADSFAKSLPDTTGHRG